MQVHASTKFFDIDFDIDQDPRARFDQNFEEEYERMAEICI